MRDILWMIYNVFSGDGDEDVTLVLVTTAWALAVLLIYGEISAHQPKWVSATAEVDVCPTIPPDACCSCFTTPAP